MKRILIALIALALLSASTLCLADAPEIVIESAHYTLPDRSWDGEFEGYWVCVGLQAPGEEAVADSFMGYLAPFFLQMQLLTHGRATLTAAGGAPTEATWTADGDKLTIVDGSFTYEAEMKGDLLAVDMDSMRAYFVKGHVTLIPCVPEESEWDGVIPGVWAAIGFDPAGTGYLMDSYMGQSPAVLLTITLNEDGTIHVEPYASEEDAGGTWSESDGVLTLSFGGNEARAEIVNGQMRLDADGSLFVLAKQAK